MEHIKLGFFVNVDFVRENIGKEMQIITKQLMNLEFYNKHQNLLMCVPNLVTIETLFYDCFRHLFTVNCL